jgi:hypothetical protein
LKKNKNMPCFSCGFNTPKKKCVVTHIAFCGINCQQNVLNSPQSDYKRLINLAKKCFQCGLDTKYYCSGCLQTPYCSRECQLSDWENHSFMCINAKREREENQKTSKSQEKKQVFEIENITLDLITLEIQEAKQELRDFKFKPDLLKALHEKFGAQIVTDKIIQEIRKNNISVYDRAKPRNITSDIATLLQESKTMVESENSQWGYDIGPYKNSSVIKVQGLLLKAAYHSPRFSTYLSGYERHRHKMSEKTNSAEENWNKDNVLRSAINSIGTKRAVSRTEIVKTCKTKYNGQFPTAFPIAVVIWILNRESRRLGRPLERYIDPSAGWGDRLAASLIAGPNIVKTYMGIDPWDVSQTLGRHIMDIIGPNGVKVELVKTTAQDKTNPWPDCDLVFTSPPYGDMECYNVENKESEDGQAWRLCKNNNFINGFIKPMLENAANATKKLDGRIIINITNFKKSVNVEGQYITEYIVKVAESIGLELTETFGMKVSSVGSNKLDYVKGEPFFVFKHTK